MRLFNSSVVAFVVFLSSSAGATVSGTYVGSGPGIAVLLQLVETNGGQLSGRYEQQKVIAGNRIEQLNAAVSGTSDGQTVVLQVRPTEVLASAYVLSGMISASVLQLRGGGYGQTLNLNLAKGTEENFKTRAAGLSASVNRAVATQSLEADLVNAEHTLQAMSKFSANPEPGPSAFAPYEQRYRTSTQGMRATLGRQQLIPRFIQTPARGQLGVAINQASVETTQIHTEVKSKQTQFKQQVTTAFEKLVPIVQRCKDSTAQTDVASPMLEKLKLQCSRMRPIVQQFAADVKGIDNSFQRLEAVWREEQQKQQTIVRSADIAVR